MRAGCSCPFAGGRWTGCGHARLRRSFPTGFLVNVETMQGWVRWIHYLSLFFYAFEAMITSELTGQAFDLQVGAQHSAQAHPAELPADRTGPPQPTCERPGRDSTRPRYSRALQASGYVKVEGVTGETFLTTLGFSTDSTTRDIAVLVGLYGGFVCICMALFLMRLPRARGSKRRWLKKRLGLHRSVGY